MTTPQSPMPGSANPAYLSNEQGFNRISGKKPRWDANIKWYDVPADNNWHRVRFLGPLHMIGMHWFESKNKKKFPMYCLNYDTATSNFNQSGGCPACALDPKSSEDPRMKAISARQQGYIHVIDRTTQQFSPMRVPISAIIGIKKQGKLNVHTVNGVSYEMDVTDPQYGQDINILYDQAADPSNKYTISLAGVAPLTEMEMGYFNRMYNWSQIIEMPPKSEIERALQMGDYVSSSRPVAANILPNIPAAPSGLPPMGTYTPQPVAPASQPWAPPAPPAPSFQAAPPPAAWAPPVNQGFQAAAEEAPVPQAPAYAPPVYAAPVQQQAPAAAYTPPPAASTPAPVANSGQRSYLIVGKPGPVSAEEFQLAIGAFAQPIAKTMPLKLWDKDDMAGFHVPKCLSTYTGDAHCMKCPVRRYCLAY